MTAADFRLLALSLPDVEESAHMDHPDFRAGGKIFATLGYPDKSWGMVKLFPDQQKEFVAADPEMFAPVKGGVGQAGLHQCAAEGGEQRAGSGGTLRRMAERDGEVSGCEEKVRAGQAIADGQKAPGLN
jgi:YjbR protein